MMISASSSVDFVWNNGITADLLRWPQQVCSLILFGMLKSRYPLNISRASFAVSPPRLGSRRGGIRLWLLSNNLQWATPGFLIFYLLCGVAAAVAQAIMSPASTRRVSLTDERG